MSLRFKFALAVLVCGASSTNAGEWDITGYLGGEGRAFWQDARFADQSDDPALSAIFQPEIYWSSDSGNNRFSFIGFARADSVDDERTHADVRELYWGYEADNWDIVLGVNKVFWGVTESLHLVDVVNQTDLVEDIDQEDKLGQPMFNVNLQRDFGRFEFFVLPYFRERTFPGPEGRLRAPLPVDTDNALYESSREQDHIDYAVRYSHYFGDVDIGIYFFDGTSREPNFLPNAAGDALLPFYAQMRQTGLELQYTKDAWLWKLEAIARDTRSDDFFAVVGGLEYTFYGVAENGADLGVLVEYLYDGRDDTSPPTAFDNDVFVGTRLAMNDAADTAVLAGFSTDVDTNELFFNVEAERRFGDSVVAELRLRLITNAEPGDATYAFARDDYLQLRLSWFY